MPSQLLSLTRRDKKRSTIQAGKEYNAESKKFFHFKEGFRLEDGSNRSFFVVAFSGGGARLMLNPYDFMSVTRLMDYPRIYLNDRSRLWYQNGINRDISSFESLCGFLEEKFRESRAGKLLILGTSSGGFAALLAGHILKADCVHAFGSQTTIGLGSLRSPSKKSLRTRAKWVAALYWKQWRNHRLFDLRTAMAHHNGKTRYYVHYSAHHRYDPGRIAHIQDVPGITSLPYPYKYHSVVDIMLENDYLKTMFAPEHLENPQPLFDMHFGKEVKIQNADTSVENTRMTIVEIIRSVAPSRPKKDQVLASRDLVSDFSLDSMNSLQLVVQLENSFGIRLNRNDVDMEALKSVDKISHIVEQTLASGSTPGG